MTVDMTVGIQLRASVKQEGFNKNFIQITQTVVDDYKRKMLIAFNIDADSGSKQADLFFRTFNIEHTGHNIAQ